MGHQNKITAGFLIAALLLLNSGLALAQTDNSESADDSSNIQREAKTERLRVDREDDTNSENLESRHNERAAKIDRMQALMRAQISRITKTVTKLETIIIRIEQYRDTLQEQGSDVAEVNRLIQQTKTQKLEVEDKLLSLKNLYSSFDTSKRPGLVVSKFTAEIRLIKRQLNEMHQVLKQIVKVMKQQERNLDRNPAAGSDSEEGE